MKTEIYYFSGTGNSLFIAKELQKRISGSVLIPIVSLLHKKVIQAKGGSVGIVFPVHALTIPIAVKVFLRKLDLASADYVFAVATRQATFFRGFEKIDRLLKKKKKKLSSHFIINLPSNDSRHKNFRDAAKTEILQLESAAEKKLDFIQKVVTNKEISREKDSEHTIGFSYSPWLNYILEKTVLLAMDLAEYTGGANYFYSDPKCTGCGICEKVCLSGKIKMAGKKPVWQKKVLCYMCWACANYCPVHAVQASDIPGVKSYTKENERYSHPYATVQDIANQKAGKQS